MTYLRKSVPKPVSGSGAPTNKQGLMTLIYADEVLSEPGRDANGVKMLGNYVMKPGAKMLQLYATPSTQKMNITIEGDEDLEGFINKLEAMHPGTQLEISEFVANSLGTGFILMAGANCGNISNRAFGSICNPMKFTGEMMDDNEGAKTNLVFAQSIRDGKIPGFYEGSYSFAENVATDETLDLLVATGTAYQLPSFDPTAEITVASIDLEAGTIVSLIGGGGANPATLDTGVPTASVATILLKDGTQWVALEDAVINLEVFSDGTDTYLKEVSRA